ncbi:MAG: DNA-binding response regulator [Actinobacteria bacterium RBG_16_70_17]|nr:MAG: DNA-binding response regulator [Actinobacteria bacterium RBG_16_70_17]
MLTAYLRAEGFEPSVAADGLQALERMRAEAPDLVILDVGMPGIDGFEVLQRIRADSDVPVIMLTARSEEVDRVVGLTVGADDYVTKPFSPRELAARIRAVLRRGRRPGEEEVLRFPGLSIDLARREVLRDGEAVTLTTLEFDLLAALASGPGRVFTRDQLLQRVWGFDYFGVDRVVDVHVANIRKALGDDAADPAVVGTVRGVGYRFLLAPA